MKKGLKIVIDQILSQGDALSAKQDDFYGKYVMQANFDLYDLLADIMRFSDSILLSSSKIEIIAQMRSVLSTKHNIKTQKNSSDLMIIVKYVVRTSRKTAHVYARVLGIAYREDIMADELAEFIRQNGGIDRIRESNADIQAVADKKARDEQELNFIKALLKEKTANPITDLQIPREWTSEVHDSKGVSDFFYPICVPVYGGYKVVGVIPMDQDFEDKVLSRVFIDLHSKSTCSEIEKQQIANAKKAISPDYLQKIKEDRDRKAKEYQARILADKQLALDA